MGSAPTAKRSATRVVSSVAQVASETGTLPALLRAVCEQIRALLSKADLGEVEARYNAGRLLLGVRRAPGTYGSHAVAQLAAELGRDTATLYRYALVPERWSPAQMAVLIARRTSKNNPLSWSHWVELAQIESDTLRASLLERTLHQSLSVRELTKIIQQQSESDGGKPTTVREALMSIVAQAERLSAQISGDLADVFEAQKPKPGDRHLYTLISRAIESHEALAARALTRVEALAQVRKRMAQDISEPSRVRSASAGRVPLFAGGRDLRPTASSGPVPNRTATTKRATAT